MCSKFWKVIVVVVICDFNLGVTKESIVFAQPGGGSKPALAATPTKPPVASGRATREVEQWVTQFQQGRKEIGELQKQIFTTVPEAMRTSAKDLKGELEKYQKEPNRANKRRLQEATAGALTKVYDALTPIVEQRERIRETVTQLESSVQSRAAALRGAAESLDKSIPQRAAELAKLQTDNNSLKDAFLREPANREAERNLRQRFEAERRLVGELNRDERMRDLKRKAAETMHAKVKEIQAVDGAIADAVLNLDLTRRDIASAAELLSETVAFEEEVEALGGGMEIKEVLAEAAQTWEASRKLTLKLDEAMRVLVEPDAPAEGGPVRLPETEFQRWVDERKAKK